MIRKWYMYYVNLNVKLMLSHLHTVSIHLIYTFFLLKDSSCQQWHVGPTQSWSWQGILLDLVHARKHRHNTTRLPYVQTTSSKVSFDLQVIYKDNNKLSQLTKHLFTVKNIFIIPNQKKLAKQKMHLKTDMDWQMPFIMISTKWVMWCYQFSSKTKS